MPWSENRKMDTRFAAIKEYHTGKYTKSELCEIYGISRPTLYKWLNRFDLEGWEGMDDRSSRPLTSPNRTSDKIRDLILTLNTAKGWQNKKIHGHLELKYPHLFIPCPSTIHNILKSHGRTSKYNRFRRWKHPGKPIYDAKKPNDVLSADYKGQFRMRDYRYCYPLTISCNYSRFLLGLFPHPGNRLEDARRDFEVVFREYGLPKAILTDNGVPFATKGIDGISQLNVWWTELGIDHIRTQPASPSQNGKHERMHRELKRLTTRPPGKNYKEQGRKLKEFQNDYNYNLKHGGIGDVTPGSLYRTSRRSYPEKIKSPYYPSHFEVRRVSANGGFRWDCERVPISHALGGKHIGLEQIDTGLYKVWFYKRFLGFYDEIKRKLEDKPGRLDRRHV
jgi:transposase InsO family protein/transposase